MEGKDTVPTGGFIPIILKEKIEKHKIVSGPKHNIMSINDIMKKKIIVTSKK